MATEKIEKKPSLSQKELKLRARAKNKKPKFIRAESWKYDRFSVSWRRPRGLDNKIRRKIKGWPAGVSVGYKGPKIARGLHPSGYREVLVNNVQELSIVDPSTQAIRIAHTVGKRKRGLIIAEAKKLDIKILNIKVSAEAEKKEEETEEKTEGKTVEHLEETANKEIEQQEAPKGKAKEAKKEKKQKKEKEPKKTKPKSKKGDKKQ
jgi:large subunit ribosomal protein L32e